MQVKLEKRYMVAAGPDAAWHVLRDIRQLAACMPGAEITEQLDNTHYKGNIKVKVGPALASFGGELEILTFDEAGKTIRFKGKGTDKSGSSASMDLTASILPGETAGQCMLLGSSDVIVNGKFAQFGGRMMTSVSDMILEKFADNFSHKAASVFAQAETAVTPPAVTGDTAQVGSAAQPHTDLNALSILWNLTRNFFTDLFGIKKS
jgi:carbon monoxide dehydrogenase subunit G